MDLKLQGKRALVTGGASGIGLATARMLLAERASVALVDIDSAGVDAAVASLREESGGRDVFAEAADVSEPVEVARVLPTLADRLGGLDILICCAARYMTKPVLDLTADEWDRLMAVNLRSVFLCCQVGAKRIAQSGGGSIVTLGSIGGQLGSIVSGANYSASKAGVICLTKSLAKQLAALNIRVNGVNPGVVDTPMTRDWPQADKDKTLATMPLGRFATPDEVAAVIVFLASPVASHVHGTHVDVNGGMFMD